MVACGWFKFVLDSEPREGDTVAERIAHRAIPPGGTVDETLGARASGRGRGSALGTCHSLSRYERDKNGDAPVNRALRDLGVGGPRVARPLCTPARAARPPRVRFETNRIRANLA